MNRTAKLVNSFCVSQIVSKRAALIRFPLWGYTHERHKKFHYICVMHPGNAFDELLFRPTAFDQFIHTELGLAKGQFISTVLAESPGSIAPGNPAIRRQ